MKRASQSKTRENSFLDKRTRELEKKATSLDVWGVRVGHAQNKTRKKVDQITRGFVNQTRSPIQMPRECLSFSSFKKITPVSLRRVNSEKQDWKEADQLGSCISHQVRDDDSLFQRKVDI